MQHSLSKLHLRRPLQLQCPLRLRHIHRLRAASDQPQQPAQQPELVTDQQQQQQQEILQYEQQLEKQQQPLAERVAEDESSAALSGAEQLPMCSQPEEPLSPEEQRQQEGWEQAELEWRRTARNAYLIMALGLTAGGLGVAVAAAPLAAAGLKLGVGFTAQQAAVLMGCWGAALLRASSLAWFLAEGAAQGELGSWRYQRINLGLAAAMAAAAAAALTAGWAGAQPWLLLLLVGGCGATAAVAAALALQQARREGFYFASALGYGDVIEGVGTLWVYLVYGATCLPGALMTAAAVVAALLGFAALIGSAVMPVLPWIDPGSSGVAAATLMHKLLGAGLLLVALQAWALIEYAANGRDISPEMAVKMMYVRTSEEYAFATGELGPAPVHVPLQRFTLLHIGFVAAAVAQGLWLAQAASTGPGLGLLNASDPLWGGLFWSVMCTVLYLGILSTRMDFSNVWVSFLRVVDWAGGLVSLGAAVLYVDWMWLAPVERK